MEVAFEILRRSRRHMCRLFSGKSLGAYEVRVLFHRWIFHLGRMRVYICAAKLIVSTVVKVKVRLKIPAVNSKDHCSKLPTRRQTQGFRAYRIQHWIWKQMEVILYPKVLPCTVRVLQRPFSRSQPSRICCMLHVWHRTINRRPRKSSLLVLTT